MIEKINTSLRDLDQIEINKDSLLYCKKTLKTFDPFSHKGNRGHAAIIAGSTGMMGAAVLCTMAANKSGAGLVSAIVPKEYFELIHYSTPEVLVLSNVEKIEFEKFNSIGIGPGLGSEILTIDLVKRIFSSDCRLVLDADMLNYLSSNPTLIKLIPTESILTPHPLEWKRLFGNAENDQDRILKTQDCCKKMGFNVLIKGHVSTFVASTGEIFYNANGNAGMAKGGSGDVLTGLLTGLLAQGYNPSEAGRLAMYVHGLAGDLAKDALGENAMTATDQIRYFSKAFTSLK